MRATKGNIYLRGTTWWLRYQHEGKRVAFSLDTGDETLARKKADELLRPFKLNDREAIERHLLSLVSDTQTAKADALALANRMPLAGAWDAFIASPARPQCSPSTLNDYRFMWHRFLATIAEVAPEIQWLDEVRYIPHGREFASCLSKDVGGHRYNMVIRGVRLVWKIITRDIDLPNPLAPVSAKRYVVQGKRELSEAELRAVCEAATGEYRVLFAIGLYTALRLIDAATLRWEDVRFRQNMISVMPRKTARTGKIVKIPLHQTLRAILEETPPAARREYVLPEIAVSIQGPSKSRVNEAIQRIFTGCGIVTQEDTGGVRKTCRVGFHSFRHSFVTLCANASIPLGVVQELCGHGSPAIQRTYIHAGVEAATAAVAALPSLNGVAHKELPATSYDARSAALALGENPSLREIEDALLVAFRAGRTAAKK